MTVLKKLAFRVLVLLLSTDAAFASNGFFLTSGMRRCLSMQPHRVCCVPHARHTSVIGIRPGFPVENSHLDILRLRDSKEREGLSPSPVIAEESWGNFEKGDPLHTESHRRFEEIKRLVEAFNPEEDRPVEDAPYLPLQIEPVAKSPPPQRQIKPEHKCTEITPVYNGTTLAHIEDKEALLPAASEEVQKPESKDIIENHETQEQEEGKAFVASSDPSDIQSRIKYFASKIHYHNRLYYQQDAPEISDAEYDVLFTEYRNLIQQYPQWIPSDDPNQTVGSMCPKGFKKVKHLKPLLSLDNAFDPQDVLNFNKKIHGILTLDSSESIEYVAELKIDGLAGAIRYRNGRLVSAATRGNGTEGENVTANVRAISEIPHQIPLMQEDVEIRGEFYLSKANFIRLNKARKIANKPLFANPRNAAAGLLRKQEPDVSAKRHLCFFAYDLVSSTPLKTHEDMLVLLKSLGFVVNNDRKICENILDCVKFYNSVTLRRAFLPYDADGVVYKVNNLDFQRRLGYVARSPRFALAHKFKAEEAITRLNFITVQVGRTGVLTPVAELTPVNVGGVLVSRATLHNEDAVTRKRLKIGDRVIVKRAGDVIPQVVKSLIPHVKFTPYKLPSNCPSCQSLTVRFAGRVARRCIAGFYCGAQVKSKLKHFVSKSAFNIKGLGAKNITFLFESGRVLVPQDLFTLQKRNGVDFPLLENEKNWDAVSVQTLFAEIQQARTIDLNQFIYALGIPHIGKVTAELLAKHYLTWNNFIRALSKKNTVLQELGSLDSIGPIAAQSIVTFFHTPRQKEWVHSLAMKVHIKPYRRHRQKLLD